MAHDKDLLKEASGMETVIVSTTLGDLICAISDAAEEAAFEAHELAQVTQLVLGDLLKRTGH